MKKIFFSAFLTGVMLLLSGCGDLLAIGGAVNFDIDIPAPNIAIKAGTTGSLTIKISRNSSSYGPDIDLTLQNPPVGFSADKVTASSAATEKTFTIAVANTVVPSNTPVKLTLEAKNLTSLTRTAFINVTVTAP